MILPYYRMRNEEWEIFAEIKMLSCFSANDKRCLSALQDIWMWWKLTIVVEVSLRRSAMFGGRWCGRSIGSKVTTNNLNNCSLLATTNVRDGFSVLSLLSSAIMPTFPMQGFSEHCKQLKCLAKGESIRHSKIRAFWAFVNFMPHYP